MARAVPKHLGYYRDMRAFFFVWGFEKKGRKMVNPLPPKVPTKAFRLQYSMQPAFEAAPASPVPFTARLLLVGDTTFPVLSFPVGYGPFEAGDWATLAGCQPALRFTEQQLLLRVQTRCLVCCACSDGAIQSVSSAPFRLADILPCTV